MKRKNTLVAIIAFFVFAFLFIPLVIIAITAFGTESVIKFPITGFTFDWFTKIFNNRSIVASLKTSLQVSFVSTLLALIIGIPATYALNKRKGKISNLLLDFFLSPTIIPGMVVGYSLYQIIVIQYQVTVWISLLLGHFIITLPYVIRVVGSALKEFDYSIEEAAWSLGASKPLTFIQIVLPNISSSIVAAFMLAFINSFNNIPVSMFLTGPGTSTFPISLMNYIEYNYDPGVSAISLVIMLVTLGLMLLIDKTIGLKSVS